MERREKNVGGGRERMKKKGRVLLVVIETSSDLWRVADGKKPNQFRQSYLG